MTSTLHCNLIYTANALPIHIFLITLRRIITFTNIATPPAGMTDFSVSAICSTRHAPGMFYPGQIHVFVNTRTAASVSLMRASSSLYLLRAPQIFHDKIFIDLVEHPRRYRDSRELSSVPYSGWIARIAIDASFPGDYCFGSPSIYKFVVFSISSVIFETEQVPAPYWVVPRMNQYLSCRLYFSQVFYRYSCVARRLFRSMSPDLEIKSRNKTCSITCYEWSGMLLKHCAPGVINRR